MTVSDELLNVERFLRIPEVLGPSTSVGRRAGTNIPNILFVDPASGSDAADGTDPRNAKATLQAAIDLTEDDRGDIIVVFPGAHSVTTQVNFNKRGITVVASNFGSPAEEAAESFTVNAASSLTSGGPAKITAPVRIIGLGFASRDLTAEGLLIDCEESGGFSGGFNELINCRFSVWYGAVDYGIRMIGGAINKVRHCSFDGLFGGFDIGAIGLQNDTGGITPAYTEVDHCVFQGVGSGKHAIVHAVGSTPVGVFYGHNRLLSGFLGNEGKLLDNNNVASTGMCADNWVAPLANQGAAFENMTNSEIGFADNHYEEA